jgi:arginase family enzyme
VQVHERLGLLHLGDGADLLAFTPGTGTPEPGGMTAGDLLWACRTLAGRLRLIGMDVVEVIPTGVGSADITALVAARIVHEALTGLAASPLRHRRLAAAGAGS